MKTSQSLRIEKHSPDSGTFSGLAWSFDSTPDSEGDVLLPSALRRAVAAHTKAGTAPVVRVEHRPETEVGRLTAMDVTARGLEVCGQIDMTLTAGRTAHAAVATGQLAALSVGFDGQAETSGRTRVFTDVALVEVSLCKRPINVGSRIEAIKSWRDVQSVRDLEKLLHGTGMPNRLALRVAKAAWPEINTDQDKRPAILAALNRIISV
jgi:HK97 family phage prohead protease